MVEQRVICIQINDQRCWCCHKPAQSHHHALPRSMEPKDNVKIPLCNKCHKKLHNTLKDPLKY